MGRDITKLHPELQKKIKYLKELCEKKGLYIGIGECYRTVAEQNSLYAKGRTEKGNIVTNAKGSSYSSMHQWGVAFDFYRNDGKGAYYDADGFFTKVGKVGQSIGLEWGGSWTSIKDKPHFQLKDWGSTPAKLKKQYGTPEKFIKTWTTTPKKTTQTVKTIEPKVTTAKINAYDGLVIRDAKGNRIGSVKFNKTITVVQKSAKQMKIKGASYTMAKIQYGSISGYVAQKYLKF